MAKHDPFRRSQRELIRFEKERSRMLDQQRRVQARLAHAHAHLAKHQERIKRRLEQKERRIRERLQLQQMMKDGNFHQPKWYQIILGVLGFFGYMSLCWLASRWLLGYVADYWPYGEVHSTLLDYLSVVGALFLFGCSISLVQFIFQPNRRSINTLKLMIEAMQRMSKGDFNISLDSHPRYAGQFHVLVHNLNRMAAELGQMEQMRQEFISNVSHEIQSPLTAIKGFAQALRNDEMTTESRNHYLRIIETESERMSRMSDNLMKLTSLESRQHPFQVHKFKLDRQIRQAVLNCEPLWDAKRLELDIQLDEVQLTGDEELLNQVWTNLLHNSIKFTPEGGTISIRLQTRNERAEVAVSDTGIGIAEHDIPHLFERFYKADKSRNRTLGGSGLGLSIVKKIVDLHAGGISVTSRPNAGTSFLVELPLQASEQLKQPFPTA